MIVADDEESPRCFVRYSRGDSIVRITLDQDDLAALVGALEEVIAELEDKFRADAAPKLMGA